MYIIFVFSIIVWLIFELRYNFRDRTKNDVFSENNCGVYLFFLIFTAFGICVLSLNRESGKIPLSTNQRLFIGSVTILAGSMLRWWAVSSLGSYFKTVLAVSPGQRVIKNGPYKYIRHPAYTGAMLVFIGCGLGGGSWAGLAAMIVFPFIGYYYRVIREEEIMIICFNKDYLSLIKTTKKFIPYLY